MKKEVVLRGFWDVRGWLEAGGAKVKVPWGAFGLWGAGELRDEHGAGLSPLLSRGVCVHPRPALKLPPLPESFNKLHFWSKPRARAWIWAAVALQQSCSCHKESCLGNHGQQLSWVIPHCAGSAALAHTGGGQEVAQGQSLSSRPKPPPSHHA